MMLEGVTIKRREKEVGVEERRWSSPHVCAGADSWTLSSLAKCLWTSGAGTSH
jgi:hypothetical protein